MRLLKKSNMLPKMFLGMIPIMMALSPMKSLVISVWNSILGKWPYSDSTKRESIREADNG